MRVAIDLPVPVAAREFPDAADRCVQCGLCLPHCPTFRVTRDENESPRGRIQLMRALARGQLPLTPKLEAHLDRCLVCRACEAVCPAQVPYGNLIDGARAHIAGRRGLPRWRRAFMNMVARPERMALAHRLARTAQRLGLRSAARRAGMLRAPALARLDRMLPELPKAPAWKEWYPAATPARGAVSLFLGCVARFLDSETIAAAIFVLNRFGYDVHLPAGQTCCGALHRHAGAGDMADRLMRANLEAFGARSNSVLYLASGCGAQLIEYPEPLRARLRDYCEFLAPDPGLPTLRTERPLTVAVHEPCTQRNALRNAASVYALLRRVGGLTAVALDDNAACCGSAGSYFLEHPEIADRLGAEKLAAIGRAATRLVVTSNIGCALHLRAGLAAQGSAVEIAHPAVLLRRILEAQGS